ncbi:FecR domain-containing protein [Rhabdobacter roseus]|uniref:Ferric-dicitrate binding protein FerR (Iron transport regulator) n=1 Tax=Rhabdobacter roseus TaxID=1655419 RepID=A0A840U071_9BACT|nr:FecR domain-containing protein [Rhabdobacter roseus]MBB5285279.1 ferric-dicitrate binding protein FerR (iron transport regulator) [Rhabdobacter roseus]
MDQQPLPPDLLRKYLTGQCSEEERRRVDAWYQSLDRENEAPSYSFDEANLLERIRGDIRQKETHQGRVLSRRWLYASVAAAAVVVMALLYLPQYAPARRSELAAEVPRDIQFRNGQKKIVRYYLPDSSQVWLNPGAQLTHPSTFAQAGTREVHFRGEGFFDVRRNEAQPFVIYSGKLKTEVLGTSFNVKANEDEPTYQVSVVTGSVAVSSTEARPRAESLVLKPNQQATFQSQTSQFTLSEVHEKASGKEHWQPVSLAFEDTPLTEVVARLQRTFKVKIELANARLGTCRLTIDLTHQRLPEILEMINTIVGTTYEMDAQRIVLSGEGCAP